MIKQSTWVILVIFVLLLGGVYLWQRSEAQKVAEATPIADDSPGNLFDFEGQVTGVRIERVGDQTLELQRSEQGEWAITWPQNLQTDTLAADMALGQLGAVPVIARLSETDDLAAMGLEPPAYRLLVTTSDGKQWVVNIGKVTPTNSGYYTLVSDRGLYVASKYTLDPILGLIDSPPVAVPAGETPAGQDAQTP